MVEPPRNYFVVATYKPTKDVEPDQWLRKMDTSTAFPRQGITDPSSFFRRKRTARPEIECETKATKNKTRKLFDRSIS